MSRPSALPADEKVRLVLSVLAGEMTTAEAARKAKVSEQSVSNWKRQFIEAGRQGVAEGCSMTRLRCFSRWRAADPVRDERERLDALIRKAQADQQALIQVAKAGANAAALAAEINATELRLRDARERRLTLDREAPAPLMPEQVRGVLEAHGAALLEAIDAHALRNVFDEVSLMLTYDHAAHAIAGEMTLSSPERWAQVRVGGGT